MAANECFLQKDMAEKLQAQAQSLALEAHISGNLCPEPLEGNAEALLRPLGTLLDWLKESGCDEIIIETDYQPDRNWYDVQLMFRFEGRSKGEALLWQEHTQQHYPLWKPVLQHLQDAGWHVASPFSATPQKLYCSIACPLAAED